MKNNLLTALLALLNIIAIGSNGNLEGDTVKSLIAREKLRQSSLERLFPDAAPDYDFNDTAIGYNLNWSDADDFLQSRLAKLNNRTPFDFAYNETVKSYIRTYLAKKPSTTARILGLSQYYFPLFEQELKKNDLPTELKCLAIVESALRAKAKSHASAVGLWQFIPSTGKLYGLKMSGHLDERSDPIKSTQAACRYLKSLYNIFGNWELALAAYNSGPGTVNRAIRLSGGNRNYWEICEFLPRETRHYVPAFIAVNYVVNYYADHGVIPVKNELRFSEFDVIEITKQTSLTSLAEVTGEPIEVLKFLNPSLKGNVIPGGSHPVSIILPREKIAMLNGKLQPENTVKAKDKKPASVDLAPNLAQLEEIENHKVARGETLFSIAKKYSTNVAELKKLNNLKGNALKLGQKLVVPTENETAAVENNLDSEEENHKKVAENLKPTIAEADLNSFAKFHVVEKGDTLWSIAQKYDGISVSELKKLNNLNNTSLKPGQKLIISIGG